MIGLKRLFSRRPAKPPLPSDILVDMICLEILRRPQTTDQLCHRGYYDSHIWLWEEKRVTVRFTTHSYASNAPVTRIERLSAPGFDGYELTEDQQQRLTAALNKANELARAALVAIAEKERELAACTAIERIVQ